MKGDAAETFVVACDDAGNAVTRVEKMQAHREAVRHKAVSVFLFSKAGEFLIQRRSPTKYHSGGLWSNSACTHPQLGEAAVEAGNRALMRELGIATKLTPAAIITYCLKVSPDMHEFERTEVFVGRCDAPPWQINRDEASDARLVTREALENELRREPENFSAWFRHMMDRIASDLVASAARLQQAD